MAVERENRFMADTSASWTSLNIYGDGNNIMSAYRMEAAAATIEKFNGAFHGKKKGGNGGFGGTRRGGK